MPVSVSVEMVHARKLAAVRRAVAPGAIGTAWRPALDQVWEFIRTQPGLRTDGHNIFLYHHPAQTGAPILCDFGVEVTRTFETAGEVYATETPAGETAVAVHRGPYDRLNDAYMAIEKWMAAKRQRVGRTFVGNLRRSDARPGRNGDHGRAPPEGMKSEARSRSWRAF